MSLFRARLEVETPCGKQVEASPSAKVEYMASQRVRIAKDCFSETVSS
jgi:hypothetical protein